MSVAKWKASLKAGPEYLSADAITGCLRTQGNTLSVWSSNDEDEIKKSLLALGASLTSIEKIDYVTLDARQLEDDALQLVNTDGRTAAFGSNFLHRDIVELDHAALAKVAEHVKRKVRDDEFSTLTKGELKSMLLDGLKTGALDETMLDKKLRQELEK